MPRTTSHYATDHTGSARVTDAQCLTNGACTCSRHNAHLWNLDDWRPDPACPRHGTQQLDWQLGNPTIDIDEQAD